MLNFINRVQDALYYPPIDKNNINNERYLNLVKILIKKNDIKYSQLKTNQSEIAENLSLINLANVNIKTNKQKLKYKLKLAKNKFNQQNKLLASLNKSLTKKGKQIANKKIELNNLEILINKLKNQVIANNFSDFKGKLIKPIAGKIIVNFNKKNYYGLNLKGIIIKPSLQKANVYSVFNGIVVYADYFKGFGNMIIIDHGDNYLTIYGNNNIIIVDVGQKVKTGQKIANISNYDEEGLYFGIRYNGDAISPIEWLEN